MKKLNLTDVSKSDIKYTISTFPDGELQITLDEFSRKEIIEVHCRITDTKDLFLLMQVGDILNRHGVLWELKIYYLMGMRMDRVMDFNKPFTCKIVCDIIKNINSNCVEVLEPHSDVCRTLITSHGVLFPDNELYCALHPDELKVHDNYQLVFPDAGARERYIYHRPDTVFAEKERNPETGEICNLKIINPEILKMTDKPLMVIDDLCDAGGTFAWLASKLRVHTNKELNIFVTHMVNEKGIQKLSEFYDHVYFTNSYKTWDNLPKNVTQIEVI